MQIDMATPRAGEVESQGDAEAPDPTAVVSWCEERLLELATSLPAMRTIRHQPRVLEAKDVHYSQVVATTPHASPPPGQAG